MTIIAKAIVFGILSAIFAIPMLFILMVSILLLNLTLIESFIETFLIVFDNVSKTIDNV